MSQLNIKPECGICGRYFETDAEFYDHDCHTKFKEILRQMDVLPMPGSRQEAP